MAARAAVVATAVAVAMAAGLGAAMETAVAVAMAAGVEAAREVKAAVDSEAAEAVWGVEAVAEAAVGVGGSK